MDLATIESLVTAQGMAQRAIEDRAATFAVQRMGTVDDWGDHAAIGLAARDTGRLVQSLSRQSAGTTDAYLTRLLAEMTGRPLQAAGALRLVQPVRRGVAGWDTAYGRVADTVRFKLSQGVPVDEAVRIGLERADVMARMDVTLARRDQSSATVQSNPRTTAFRRVIHPELSETGTCGLCIAAADRRYNRGDLMPLHDRCKCEVVPITAEGDPGGTLNNADLADVYTSAESNYAKDLLKVRYQVRDHGELGPVLVDARHHWRGPLAVAAA